MPGTDSTGEISYRNEVIRKAIHLCSLSIPIIYHFVTRDLALMMLVPVTIFVLVVDLGRYAHPALGGWFNTLFGWLLRKHESDRGRKRLNGATYVLISATLCVLFFPKPVMITAFSVLVLGDLTAALIGRRFGRHKLFNKSWEGTIAFFLVGFAAVSLNPYALQGARGVALGAFAVAVGAFVEALPWPIDDNFSVPISVGMVLWAGQLVM